MSSPLTHLQLVPADNVTASYDNEAKMLILTANGTQVDITRDINFHRLPFAGGLLFELHGWVGPIIRGDSPYSVTNGFNIDLPNPVTPSNTVVINTANKQGWVIPIQGLQQNGAAAANGKSSSGVPEVKETVGDQKIVAGLGQPFTIKQSDSFKGQGGTVDIAFDNRFVTLTDASIRDGNIEWTFVSLQTGATELAVYVGQTNPPFMYREVYVASIVPPNSNYQVNPTVSFAVSPNKGTNGTNGSKVSAAKDAAKDGLPLSWDGFVNIGFNLIKKQQPDAQLYEIDATPATTQPVANEWGLVNNRIVATLPANKTAIIQSNGWGSFGPVQIIDGPFMDDQVIRWPVPLDIHDAFTILRNAGYKELVGAVTLRKPLYPGIDQPFYIFNVGQEFIAVGVQDKKIHNFGPTGREIQQSK